MLTITDEQLARTSPFTVRRYSTRYEPTHREACLCWSDSSEETCATEPGSASQREPEVDGETQFALLLDISLTGASIALDRVPRMEGGVWFRLDGECLTEWAEAEVVGITTSKRGPHLVRLAFRAPCPFETLRSAVCG